MGKIWFCGFWQNHGEGKIMKTTLLDVTAIPMGLPPDIVNPKISNYMEWQDRISKLFDPNGIIPGPVRRG